MNRKGLELLVPAVVGVAVPGVKAEEPEINLEELEQRTKSLKDEVSKTRNEEVFSSLYKLIFGDVEEEEKEVPLGKKVVESILEFFGAGKAYEYFENTTEFSKANPEDMILYAKADAVTYAYEALKNFRSDNDRLEHLVSQNVNGKSDAEIEELKKRLVLRGELVSAVFEYLNGASEDESLRFDEETVEAIKDYVSNPNEELKMKAVELASSSLRKSDRKRTYLSKAGQILNLINEKGIAQRVSSEQIPVRESNRYKLLKNDGLSDEEIVDMMDLDATNLVDADKIYEGINMYKAALELDPDNFWIYNGLGFAYSKVGDFGNAEVNYKLGLSLNPNCSLIHFNLAGAYSKQNRNKEAALELDTYLRLEGSRIDSSERIILERFIAQHIR